MNWLFCVVHGFHHHARPPLVSTQIVLELNLGEDVSPEITTILPLNFLIHSKGHI